jgi:hypothetical protein
MIESCLTRSAASRRLWRFPPFRALPNPTGASFLTRFSLGMPTTFVSAMRALRSRFICEYLTFPVSFFQGGACNGILSAGHHHHRPVDVWEQSFQEESISTDRFCLGCCHICCVSNMSRARSCCLS